MARWEKGVSERLQRAALELFARQGYDGTTIGEIADHVGVTSRTYFRYFPDKKEVLFGGADRLRERIEDSLREAPADMTAIRATLHALMTCEDLFDLLGLEDLMRRDAIIDQTDELREREAGKLATIARSIHQILMERGSNPREATLTADIAVLVFKQATHLWMHDASSPYAALVLQAYSDVQGIMKENLDTPTLKERNLTVDV